MRYLFYLTFVIALLPSVVAGQDKVSKRPKVLTEKDVQLSHRYGMCLDKNTYTLAQRLKLFPFDKGVKIELISYDGATPNSPITIDTEPKPIPAEDTMAIFTPMAPNRYHVNYHRIIEKRELTPGGVDSLTDILFNVGFLSKKTYDYPDPKCSCYSPENAILFMNNKGEVIQYVELCFNCEKYYCSSSKIMLGEFCTQKFGILKALFRNQGLKYGTERLPSR